MSQFKMPIQTPEEVRSGIIYMIVAVFVFSIANALVKWLAERYPINEIIFFRCFFAILPCMVLVMTHGGLACMRTERLWQHGSRAVIQFVSMASIFTAFSLMPLADAVAITFASPLFLTVLSIFMLGEQVGRYRWSAVVVGFIGVMIMVRPGSGVFEFGALLALTNAVLSASLTIAVRRMSLTETSTALVAYQVLFTSAISALLLPLGWTTPADAFEFFMLASVGLLSGVGQYLWTQAFKFAPAAVAAPFSYMSMVWSLALGFLVWGDIPTPALVIGAMVVVASGLFILWRETVVRGHGNINFSVGRKHH